MLVFAVPSAVAGAATTAAVGDPPCGATITSSTVLTANMHCGNGVALTVGANDITLNLNGFTIDGSDPVGDVGVHNPGYSNVTVENGTIQNFETSDLDVSGSAVGDTFEHLVLDPVGGLRSYTIMALHPTDFLIDHVTAGGGGNNGIYLFCQGTGGNTVEHSSISGDEFGIVESDCGGGSITHNVVTQSVRGISFGDSDLTPTPPVMDISFNVVTRSETGLLVGSNAALVSHNQIDSNGAGIEAYFSSGTSFVDNTADDNGFDGILVAGPSANPSGNIVLRNNVTNGNGLISGNGISISGLISGTPNLTNNVSDNNSGHGYYSSVPTIGSGNIAIGNQTLPECINVSCISQAG
jgi:parallel beta-helix repeat protein